MWCNSLCSAVQWMWCNSLCSAVQWMWCNSLCITVQWMWCNSLCSTVQWMWCNSLHTQLYTQQHLPMHNKTTFCNLFTTSGRIVKQPIWHPFVCYAVCSTQYAVRSMQYAMQYAVRSMQYSVCRMQYAVRSMQYAVCRMQYAMQYAVCSTQYAVCSMLCSMQYAVCSTQYAVRSMPHAVCADASSKMFLVCECRTEWLVDSSYTRWQQLRVSWGAPMLQSILQRRTLPIMSSCILKKIHTLGAIFCGVMTSRYSPSAVAIAKWLTENYLWK